MMLGLRAGAPKAEAPQRSNSRATAKALSNVDTLRRVEADFAGPLMDVRRLQGGNPLFEPSSALYASALQMHALVALALSEGELFRHDGFRTLPLSAARQRGAATLTHTLQASAAFLFVTG